MLALVILYRLYRLKHLLIKSISLLLLNRARKRSQLPSPLSITLKSSSSKSRIIIFSIFYSLSYSRVLLSLSQVNCLTYTPGWQQNQRKLVTPSIYILLRSRRSYISQVLVAGRGSRVLKGRSIRFFKGSFPIFLIPLIIYARVGFIQYRGGIIQVQYLVISRFQGPYIIQQSQLGISMVLIIRVLVSSKSGYKLSLGQSLIVG